VSAQTLAELIRDCYLERVALLMQHENVAQVTIDYDANNAYQYIINREDTQLSWVGRAIVDLGGDVPATGAEPERKPSGKGTAAVNGLFQEDARDAATFVERWKPKVEGMTNARHRGMLRVILGETIEQQRTFEQALAGRTDLLGRRTDGVGKLVGEVLPTRWVE